MSNKFLGSSGENQDVSNGTVKLYGSLIGAANLKPSQALKTNSQNVLVSSKLFISDVENLQSKLNSAITNPYNQTLKVEDLETKNYFSVEDELQKIDNFSASTPQVTNLNGRLKAGEVFTDTISDAGGNVFIQMDATDINFSSTNLTWNGSAIGGVENPMVATLDGGGQDINNVNSLTVSTIDSDSMIQSSSNTEFITPVQTSGFLTVTGGLDVFSGSTYNGNNISGVNTITMTTANCQSFLEVSSPNPVIVNTNASAGFTIDPTGFFNIKKVSGLTVVPMLSITDATKINMTVDLDMNNNSLQNVSTINGLTPANGVYAGISDSIVVNAANSPASLVPVTGVGFLTVPANTFTVGASYHLVASGIMPSEQKGDLATVELSATNSVTVSLGNITVELDASADTAWECEGDFTCRGPLGVNCVFITAFELTFNKDLDKNFRGTRKISSAVINTTVQQSLDITGTLTGISSFQTRLLTLTRVF